MDRLVCFCTTGSLHYDSQVTCSEYESLVGITLCVSCARLLRRSNLEIKRYVGPSHMTRRVW